MLVSGCSFVGLICCGIAVIGFDFVACGSCGYIVLSVLLCWRKMGFGLCLMLSCVGLWCLILLWLGVDYVWFLAWILCSLCVCVICWRFVL